MKQNRISRLFIMLLMALGFHLNLKAQKVTEEKLLGCWKIKSVEFLEPTEDSLEIINSTKGMITCFEKNGKFISKIRQGNIDQTIGTGTYNIAKDGKTVNQKRDANDDGIDEPAEIIKISTKALSFKFEQIVLNFERITN